MKKQSSRKIFRARIIALGLCLSCAAVKFPGAVEVSLEENRAERGSIGYVDMQAVFRLFPQTQKAKENFEEVVRQAEDQINLRKAELISLRAEISQLKAERDFLAKNPIVAEGSDSDASDETPPPLPGTEEIKPPAKNPQTVQTPPAVSPSSSTSTSSSTFTVVAATTAVSSAFPQVQSVSKSTAAAEPSVAPSTAATGSSASDLRKLPGIAPEKAAASQNQPARPTGKTTLGELDIKVADKTKLLDQKDAEFKTYQAQVEKNLLDLESRRTEIILGRIYEVVQQVARDEGVSVVVDKSQILFGHKAVDLTPKVLDKLKNL